MTELQQNYEDAVEFTSPVPTPYRWQVVLLPLRPKEKSAGGIILTNSTQTAETYNCCIGKILSMGDQAFTGEKLEVSDPPKVGDYVVHGKFAGLKLPKKTVDGDYTDILVIRDDEIIMPIDDPNDYKIKI